MPERSVSAAISNGLGSGPIPSLAAIGRALAAIPEAERFQFAEALAARALAWRRTPSGATLAPIVVRVEPDPSMADVDEAEPDAYDSRDEDE